MFLFGYQTLITKLVTIPYQIEGYHWDSNTLSLSTIYTNYLISQRKYQKILCEFFPFNYKVWASNPFHYRQSRLVGVTVQRFAWEIIVDFLLIKKFKTQENYILCFNFVLNKMEILREETVFKSPPLNSWCNWEI